MPYAIYLRKSRADAEAESRGEGETLARHEQILLDVAKCHKLPVTAVYKEIVSGETISARPVMQQLLSEVEKGMWEGVLVVEVERLARGDTIDQGIIAQTFKLAGTRIITPVKTYNPDNEFDEEYFEFGLFMSRREYKVINRRLQRGRLQSVAEGKYVAQHAPFGYIKVKLEQQKGFTLKPDPERADILKNIYNWYVYGDSGDGKEANRIGISKIVCKLNNMGISPAKSKAWSLATVRDILRNPVYTGKIRWNWRPTVKQSVNGEIKISRPRTDIVTWTLVDGLHPELVDIETWDKAQEILGANQTPPVPATKKVMNPLAGIVICGMCGKRMVRRPYGNGYPDTLMCYDTACKNVSSILSAVERRVLTILDMQLQTYKIEYSQSYETNRKNEQIKFIEKTISQRAKELADLTKQQNNLHNLLEQGIYTVDVFLKRSQIISDKKVELNMIISAITSQLETAKKEKGFSFEVIPKIESVLSVYDTLSAPEQKNECLKEAIGHVVYAKINGGRWHRSPDDFDIELCLKFF